MSLLCRQDINAFVFRRPLSLSLMEMGQSMKKEKKRIKKIKKGHVKLFNSKRTLSCPSSRKEPP